MDQELSPTAVHDHETFEHSLLPVNVQDNTWIRILQLLPGSHDDPLQCILLTLNLKELSEEYEALSYACGNPSIRRDIMCESKCLSVVTNLYSALHHMRHPDRPRNLWADGICINEADAAERSYQVNIISKIYSRAVRVLCWLGEASENSQRAMQELDELSNVPYTISETDFVPSTFLSESEQMKSLAAHTSGGPLKAQLRKHKVYRMMATTHIGLLLQRPWFQRLWVVQEIASAREVLLICGPDVLALSKFMHGLTVARLSGVAKMNYEYWLSLGTAYHLQALNDTEFGLLELLQSFRSRQASDDRDKVFALLGLRHLHNIGLSGSDMDILVPDYTLDTHTLYKMIADLSLQDQRTLNYLSIPRGHGIDLPSWVVDWSTSDSATLSFPLARTGTSHAAAGCRAEVSIVGGVLILQGYVIDQLETVTTVFPDKVSDWDVKTSFPPEHNVFVPFVVRAWSMMWWWASVFSVLATISAEWDRLAADDPEEYCQTLNVCDEAPMESFLAWYRARSLTRLCWKLRWRNGVLYSLLAVIEFRLFALLNRWSQTTFPRYLYTAGRRLGRTKHGHLALLPGDTRAGDQIGLCKGGLRPLVMRRSGQNWLYVGDSYVHGIMSGELWNEKACEEIRFI